MSSPAESVSPKPRKFEQNGQNGSSATLLPTERIAFPKQIDILRAWAIASGPSNKMVTHEDVARIVKMAASTVRIINPFFADIGLLQKLEGGFTPSPEVVSFNRAFEWNPETAPYKLAPIFENSWFAQALMGRITFSPLGKAEAIQILAEAADVGPEREPQLSLLLDYLEKAGLIVQENGMVCPRRQTAESSATTTTTATTQAPVQTRSALVATAFTAPTDGVVQFHVSVKVDMK